MPAEAIRFQSFASLGIHLKVRILTPQIRFGGEGCSMLETVFGAFATLATWSQYPGMFHQITMVWRKNIPSNLAPKVIKASLTRNVAFMVWAAAFDPVDWIMFIARVPGLYISTILGLQTRSPRLSFRVIAGWFTLITLVSAGLAFWMFRFPETLRPFQLVFRFIGFVATFHLVTFGLHQQLLNVRARGTAGLSGWYMGCAWVGFAGWFAYSIVTLRWDLIVCYAIGTVAQTRVVLAYRLAMRNEAARASEGS